MSSSAAWRTIFGVSSIWLTGTILPSILIMTGAKVVKNRSDAFLSTINLKRGLTFIQQPRRRSEMRRFVFLSKLQTIGLLGSERRFALALQLDSEPELVLRVCVTHGVFV